jgi:UDP-2,3-diacylglucosamine hydrolase
MLMYYFVSDLHLRDEAEKNYQSFLAFLRRINSPSTKALFMVGDIFDLWVADHSCFINTYKDIVAAVHELTKNNIQVYYFEGNHDLYLKGLWEDEMGCKVIANHLSITLDGVKFRIEHGDLANPEDKSYLRYRAVLRSSFFNWLAYKVPGKLVQDLGLKASRESRKTSVAKRERVEKILDTYVNELSKTELFDVFVSGHFHERIDKVLSSSGKQVRNINLGWWKDERKVLVFNKGDLSWLEVDR